MPVLTGGNVFNFTKADIVNQGDGGSTSWSSLQGSAPEHPGGEDCDSQCGQH